MSSHPRKTSPEHKPYRFHSREPEALLLELYDFFRAHIPLDVLDLPIYDSVDGTLRYLAFVTKEGVVLTDETIRLSKRGMREVKRAANRTINVFGNSLHSPVLQEVVARYPFPQPFSALTIHTAMGDHKFAAVSPVALGENRYEDRHLDFVQRQFEQITWCARYVLSQLEISCLQARLSAQHEEILKRLGLLGDLQIIGTESGLRTVMHLVGKVAPLNSPILITGETGVGKEVIASAIHRTSKRANGPMIGVNCGAIPETLLDSELFGHEKGAFTGASGLKRGYFEQAHGGTIFLDEIGELSLSAQVRLLRLLQTTEFQRVGGSRPISADVRVIAATNRNLLAAVQNNLFRKDLWFRINVFPIHVPPLRERPEDIPALAEFFARRKTHEMSLSWQPVFAEGAIAQLQGYHWPGNVRELQNVIERALILSAGSPISFPNLQMTEGIGEVRPLTLTLRSVMTEHIIKCLKMAKGRIEGHGGAAELLDLHPSTLRAKMRKFGIRPEALRSET